MTKRLAELAQQIDNEDSLANIDSLISAAQCPANKEIAGDFTSSMLEADSLEDILTSVPDSSQLMDIQVHCKDVETRQLLNELQSLEQEIASICTQGQSRSQWSMKTLDIATEDLTDNKIMKFSYEDVGSQLESPNCSSVSDIDISDPPRPQRASLPSPVPNMKRLSAKRDSGVAPPRQMVEHSGAVGVTRMWIPAGAKPRIQPATSSSNFTNKNLQKLTIRDNGRAIGKKLQILSILPNKAEGSQSWNERILLLTQLMLDSSIYRLTVAS